MYISVNPTKIQIKLQAYLSGGIEYTSDGGMNWRREIEKWLSENLSHQVFNPVTETEKFLAENYSDVNFRDLKVSSLEKYRKIMRKIVERDMKALNQCDYVICLWDESASRGAGTQGEITLAKFLKKPIFIVSKFKPSEIPSWVIGCADKIFESFDELKSFLLNKFKCSDATDESRD